MTYRPFFLHDAEQSSELAFPRDKQPAPRWVITCDHATNTIPPFINQGGAFEGDLGLPVADMERHIAYDPGAYGVARALGALLNAPVIASNFSRLVIDPNRGEDDPTLLMQLYDGTIIPGNRAADATERDLRLNRCYRPYHQALSDLAARRSDTVIISIHSFTRQLRGRPPRPWEIGILYPEGERLSPALIRMLEGEGDLTVGANEPYTGYLPGDSIDRHATKSGRANTLIELRNDLIETESQQHNWADRLARLLPLALAQSGA